MAAGLLVLKIGGSLLDSGRLASVLSIVARRMRPVVIVPGGGPFADQVRQAQRQNGFDDATAHRLALFAMHQMANVIAACSPHFAPAASREEFARLGIEGLIPVWLPAAMASADPTMPRNWEMTSDSLAAWLAAEVGASEVALIKSCAVEPEASLESLTARGVVDPLFRSYVERFSGSWSVIGKGDDGRLVRLVAAAGERH